MAKTSRAGGKYTGTHTTLIPLAATVCDIAHTCINVTKISPGFITSGLRPLRGLRRIKINEREAGLRLSIRDNTSLQEIHLYVTDIEATKKALALSLKDQSIKITS